MRFRNWGVGSEFDTPTTYAIADGQALEEIGGTLSYPCVVKLRRGAGAVGLSFPESREQLKQVFERRRPEPDMVFDYDNLLVQEYIPGEVHDACLLFHEGEVRASLTQHRLRMYPSRGGVGTVIDTTDEPELIERAVPLLESLKWHGPAQVEFKTDTRDGRPKLIEVNGRYWGALDLSIRAGVNFPLLACRMARDGDVEPVLHYQTGLRYRWPLPFGVLDILERKQLRSSLRDFRGPHHDAISDLRITDPVPVAAEVFFILQRVGARRLRDIRRFTGLSG